MSSFDTLMERASDLEAENKALRARLSAVERLLVCYRVGKQPSEALHRALESSAARLAELEHGVAS